MRTFEPKLMERTARVSARRLLRLAWISNVAPVITRAAESAFTPLSQERLFDALDGQTIRVFHRTWRVHVYSIWEENGFRWLQLSLDGETPYTATLQMSPLAGAEQTIRRLSAWLAKPSKTHHILSVA
jgi:hypothetical protein